MYFADNHEREAFTGETRSPEGKLIYGSTDDRGRVRSEYFTDEKGRLRQPYICIGESADYNDATTAITLTTQNTFYGWTTAALISENGNQLQSGKPWVFFEDNGTADRIVIGQEGGGIWMANLAYSVHSGGAAIQLTCGVFKNGTISPKMRNHRYLSGTNDMGAAAASAMWELDPGDYLDVRFSARNANSKSIDVHYMNFSMFRVSHLRN
jgi:hypothetical protein